MKQNHSGHYMRSLVWFLLTGFMLAGFGVASIVDPTSFEIVTPVLKLDRDASQTLNDLQKLGLLKHLSQASIENLLEYQRKSNRSLAQILQDPKMANQLGFSSTRFKSTWYAANPFDFLPPDLQLAIKKKKIPLNSRAELDRWCRANKAPKTWVMALRTALIETTPRNLARAAEGKRPYAKNGQFLEPIVVQRNGVYEVQDGHIATDPRIIPTNSIVWLVVKVNGKDHLIRAKATDIGEAIRGQHVDLPIYFKPKADVRRSPYIYFPKEYINNPSVMILTPKLNRGQKA